MLFDNGQTYNSSIELHRGTSQSLNIYKMPRGILLKVNNTQFWEDCSECF